MIGSRTMRSAAVQHRLGDLLAKHLAAANLLGRTQIAREVKRKTGKNVAISTGSRLHVHFAEDADDPAVVGFSVNLPNDQAADYLRNLTPVTKDTFDGLTQQYRKDAFTIAGTSDVRLIQKIRDQLAEVMKDGGTKADFDKAADKLTAEAGVEKINAFTLDTVFQINMQKAYSLGRLEQLQHPAVLDALPIWEYMTVGDDRVRATHAALDGFQAQAIDPVWKKIYPPWDFGCRCTVIALLREEAGDDAMDGGYDRLPLLDKLGTLNNGFTRVAA